VVTTSAQLDRNIPWLRRHAVGNVFLSSHLTLRCACRVTEHGSGILQFLLAVLNALPHDDAKALLIELMENKRAVISRQYTEGGKNMLSAKALGLIGEAIAKKRRLSEKADGA
jgi:hypothetical protein